MRRLLLDAFHQKTEIFINAVNWSEVIYTCLKRGGSAAQPKVQQLSALPLTLVTVDERLAVLAASYRLNFKLHVADALALATAMQTNSTLLIGDYDFRQPGLPGTIRLLPRK